LDSPALNKYAPVLQFVLVAVILLLLVGPNFGPIPGMLRTRLPIEAAVIGVLAWFLVAFAVIVAVIIRTKSGVSFREQLRSLGLGAPSRLAANMVGAIIGFLWGFLLIGSIIQFDPHANVTQINGLRVSAALLSASAAVLEDLVTRTFLMNQLQKMRFSGWIQALASAGSLASITPSGTSTSCRSFSALSMG